MPEAEVLPHRDRRGVQRADQDLIDELPGALRCEPLIERDHYELLDAELRDQLGLLLEARQQLRRCLRSDHAQRVRLEREHGVAAPDHLAVSLVDAVELPDRHPPRARLGVGQHRHPHRRGSACKPHSREA